MAVRKAVRVAAIILAIAYISFTVALFFLARQNQEAPTLVFDNSLGAANPDQYRFFDQPANNNNANNNYAPADTTASKHDANTTGHSPANNNTATTINNYSYHNQTNFLKFPNASQILQSPNLPNWVKGYVAFHNQQRQRHFEAIRNNRTSNVRFLIVRCLKYDVCGGASDRLQDMPYNLMMASQTGRVMLVTWERPAKLETFLVPPDGGIDWRVPEDIWQHYKTWTKQHGFGYGHWNLDESEAGKRKIVSVIRRGNAAPMFRKYEKDVVGHKIYHELFGLLFTPSPALADRVEITMKSLDLAPKNYSSIHLRVKYPIGPAKPKIKKRNPGRVVGDFEKDFSFAKLKGVVTKWADNAVNCAVELDPNSTIYYVSSDNNDTVGYLLQDSQFAQHHSNIMWQRNATASTNISTTPLVGRLVARDYSRENEHIEFSKNRDIDGFMSVFEDLIIMASGKCMAHGMGGFGRLASALSGGECVVAHRGRNMKVCGDALANK